MVSLALLFAGAAAQPSSLTVRHFSVLFTSSVRVPSLDAPLVCLCSFVTKTERETHIDGAHGQRSVPRIAAHKYATFCWLPPFFCLLLSFHIYQNGALLCRLFTLFSLFLLNNIASVIVSDSPSPPSAGAKCFQRFSIRRLITSHSAT